MDFNLPQIDYVSLLSIFLDKIMYHNLIFKYIESMPQRIGGYNKNIKNQHF